MKREGQWKRALLIYEKIQQTVTYLWKFAFILFYKRMQDTIIIGESDYEIQFQFLVDLIDTESHSFLLTFDYAWLLMNTLDLLEYYFTI